MHHRQKATFNIWIYVDTGVIFTFTIFGILKNTAALCSEKFLQSVKETEFKLYW